MERRSLAGISVSKIGFGAWGIGGDSYGDIDRKQALDVLKYSFERGINFYDTSDLYGAGRSEELLGEAFSNVRSEVVLASKCGALPHSTREMPTDFSPGNIRKSLENSLRRLKTDYLDFYQMHSPPPFVFDSDESIETLLELKKEGKVRKIGVSVKSPSDGIVALKKFNFDSIQMNLNLIDQRAIECGLLELASAKNTGVIARTPLCFGFLTGNIDPKTVEFPQNDHRRLWPRSQIERWCNAPQVFREVRERHGASVTQFALGFCTSVPGVATTIPGMMKREEVDQNINSPTQLSKSDLDQIMKIYLENEFFDPKLRLPVQESKSF